MNIRPCTLQSTATKLIHCFDSYKKTSFFFPTFQVFPILLHHDSKTVWKLYGLTYRERRSGKRPDRTSYQHKRTRKNLCYDILTTSPTEYFTLRGMKKGNRGIYVCCFFSCTSSYIGSYISITFYVNCHFPCLRCRRFAEKHGGRGRGFFTVLYKQPLSYSDLDHLCADADDVYA